MATNETPEQFRERITRIAAEADGAVWDEMDPTYRPLYESQALAVYTQAIRDVLDLFDTVIEDGPHPIDTHDLHGALHIMHFAREHGIDLTDTEAQ